MSFFTLHASLAPYHPSQVVINLPPGTTDIVDAMTRVYWHLALTLPNDERKRINALMDDEREERELKD